MYLLKLKVPICSARKTNQCLLKYVTVFVLFFTGFTQSSVKSGVLDSPLILALPVITYYFQKQAVPLTGLPGSGLSKPLTDRAESEYSKPLPGWLRLSSPTPLDLRSKKVLAINSTQCLSVNHVTPDHGRLWQCFNSKGSQYKTTVDVPLSHLNGLKVSMTANQVLQMDYSPLAEADKYSEALLPDYENGETTEALQRAREYEQEVHEAIKKRSEMLDRDWDPDPLKQIEKRKKKDEFYAIRLRVSANEEDSDQSLSDILFELTHGHSRKEEKELQDDLESIRSGPTVRARVLEDGDEFYMYPDTTLQVSRDHYYHLIHYFNPNSSSSDNKPVTTESQGTPANNVETAPPEENLSVTAPDNSRGIMGYLRTVFYRYDIDRGTCPNLLPYATAVTASGCLTASLVSRFAGSIPDKVEQSSDQLLNFAVKSPVIPVAVGVASLTWVAIRLLGSSLKPGAVSVVQGLRSQVQANLESAARNQFYHRERAIKLTPEVKSLFPAFEEENKKSLEVAEERYRIDKARYDKDFDIAMAGVIGIVGIQGAREAMKKPDPTSSHNQTHSDSGAPEPESIVSAGLAITRFMRHRDGSFWSQRDLLNALEPVLTSSQYDTVRTILRRLPAPPVRKVIDGENAQKYKKTKMLLSYSQEQAELARKEADKIMRQYPGFRLDENGKATLPSLDKFWRGLPE